MNQTLVSPSQSVDLSHFPLGASFLSATEGTVFRVWAPHATAISVVGSFNAWDPQANVLQREGDVWSAHVTNANEGAEYRYRILHGEQELLRNDPRAKKVTNSVGNSVIWREGTHRPNTPFVRPPQNRAVIYEMHIGTFHVPEGLRHGTFDSAITKLPYLRDLGINLIELMPVAEFAGDFSWGYNPAHPWAIESAYGGPEGLHRFVSAAHELGLGVILDVVYNHFGPSDLDLWQFDGESFDNKGGIYFYSDERASTPWGDSRPDYGRGEVRSYLRDNAFYFIEEFNLDGLRWDMTAYIRTRDGGDQTEIPEGWSLCAWINDELQQAHPGLLTIAEDMKNNEWIVKPRAVGGAGFSAQWDSAFVHPVRRILTQLEDAHRDLDDLVGGLRQTYDGDAFKRVIYSESHDEVANGKARLPSEIDPARPDGEPARRRSMLGALFAFTCPGLPMLFQGQEFLESEWFRDEVPLRWEKLSEFAGIHRFYRDGIQLRLHDERSVGALCGRNLAVNHINHLTKVLAYRRWSDDEASDLMIVINLSAEARPEYVIGVPHAGEWITLLNTDSSQYSDDFTDLGVMSAMAEPGEQDGYANVIKLRLGPYSGMILHRSR